MRKRGLVLLVNYKDDLEVCLTWFSALTVFGEGGRSSLDFLPLALHSF